MRRLSGNSWGRWTDALRTRLRPPPPAAVEPASRGGRMRCEHCGHDLPGTVASSFPRCLRCGDGDPSLALYSRYALQAPSRPLVSGSH